MKRLLRKLVPSEWRDSVEGDLEELYETRRAGGTPELLARARVCLDALSISARFWWERPRRSKPPKGESFMDSVRQDLVFALRSFWKSKSFTLVAVVTLALGIGANVVLFAVIDALLVRPLPFGDAERLVLLWGDHEQLSRQFGTDELPANPPTFLAWRDNDVFDGLAAMRVNFFNTELDGDAQRMVSVEVSPSLFELFGVAPILGRAFAPDEETEGRHRVVLLGYELWRNRYESSPDVVGTTLDVSGEPYEIVGVMPPNFRFPENTYLPAPYQFPAKTELWTPLAFSELERTRGRAWNLTVVGRLREGVKLVGAEEAMNVVAQRLEAERPENTGWRVRLTPLRAQMTGELETALFLLAGTVALVLLIACANIANLLLSHASARESEIALRAALGGTKARLLRQLLTESLLLGLAGGAAACAVLATSEGLWSTFVPQSLPLADTVRLDARVLGFALLLSLVAAVAFGLVAALRVSGRASAGSLLGRGTTSRTSRLEGLLVVSEVAMCLVLLFGAGLLLRSFHALMTVDPGFRTSGLLTMEIQRPTNGYDVVAGRRFFRELVEGVEALPSVSTAAVGTNLPLAGAESGSNVIVEGRPDPGPGQRPHAHYYSVSPSYFSTLAISAKAGRLLATEDREDTVPVAVVSESFARRIFSGENAVGRRFRFAFDDDDEWYEIVGVVGDVRMSSLEIEPRPTAYLPHAQMSSPLMFLAVGSDVAPDALAASVRGVVRELDPAQPVAGVMTMVERASRSVTARRYVLTLLGAFALLALTLATVGIYGVVSYSVARRTKEVGLRMALGAARRDVLTLVLKRGLTLAAFGAVAGLTSLFFLARFVEGLLFEISTFDPGTLLAVTSALLATAALASYLPARRASAIEPVVALRHD